MNYNCIIITPSCQKVAISAYKNADYTYVSLNLYTSEGSGWGKNGVNIFPVYVCKIKMVKFKWTVYSTV